MAYQSFDLASYNNDLLEQAKNIQPEQLPNIIGEQFTDLKKLEDKVVDSVSKASKAKSAASNAADKSAKLGHKKEAIISLQDAVLNAANAQVDIADAQQLFFDYLSKMTAITKFLFMLGASNIANTRTVITQLEMKLRGASEDELSELARQELTSVVIQLKMQEDIIKKQDELGRKFKEKAGEYSEKFIELENEAQRGRDKDSEQDKELFKQRHKDEEHDERLKSHSEKLAKQQDKDVEHDKKISALEAETQKGKDKDSEQDRALNAQRLKDEEHDKNITENRNRIILLENNVVALSSTGNLLSSRIDDLKALTETYKSDISGNISSSIAELRADISAKHTEYINKINFVETFAKRIGWKIAISVVAGAALLIDILQLLNII